jgi:hypothetical protein
MAGSSSHRARPEAQFSLLIPVVRTHPPAAERSLIRVRSSSTTPRQALEREILTIVAIVRRTVAAQTMATGTAEVDMTADTDAVVITRTQTMMN